MTASYIKKNYHCSSEGLLPLLVTSLTLSSFNEFHSLQSNSSQTSFSQCWVQREIASWPSFFSPLFPLFSCIHDYEHDTPMVNGVICQFLASLPMCKKWIYTKFLMEKIIFIDKVYLTSNAFLLATYWHIISWCKHVISSSWATWHECTADRSAPTVGRHHVYMEQNLKGMYSASCWIHAKKSARCSPAIQDSCKMTSECIDLWYHCNCIDFPLVFKMNIYLHSMNTSTKKCMNYIAIKTCTHKLKESSMRHSHRKVSTHGSQAQCLHTNNLIKSRQADITCVEADYWLDSSCLSRTLSGTSKDCQASVIQLHCFVSPIWLLRCFWLIIKVSCSPLVLNHVLW